MTISTQDTAARIAELERDLALVQHTLREYMSQREAAEDELRVSEERYRQMFERNTAVKLLIDPADGRIVDVNDAAALFYGYSRDTLLKMHIADINVLPADRISDGLRSAVTQQHSYFIFPHRLASGEIRTVEVHSGPVSERDRTLLYSIVHDITERHRAEAALRASESRYAAFIQRAPYGIYRATLEGRLLEANPALVAMLGYDTLEELLALDLTRDLYADPEERRRIVAHVRAEHSLDWVEVRWRRKDSSLITVRLSARAVPDVTGAPAYLEGMAENITELARRETLLRRSERMASLGNTLAGVAHELNNPLAAISGFAQLMLKANWPEEDRSALEMINHEAGRAARVVKDLLTFARNDNSAQPPRRVDLNAVVRYIVGTQRYSLETRGTTLECTLADDLPMVLGDPTQLEQVVLNLVVNARQAMEGRAETSAHAALNSSIRIRSYVLHGHAVVEIADSGPGISAADCLRIWEPFWTTKAEGEGTGLGLSVVHGIVNSLGGTIDVESEIGEGTRFTIVLPPAPAINPPPRTSPARGMSGPADVALAPLDILVVDRDASSVSYLTHCLGERGHAVVSASSGDDGLALATQASFDVVLCDLRTTGAGMAEIARRLRASPASQRTRIIVCASDSASPSTHALLEEIHPDGVVGKPYDILALRAAIEGEPRRS